MHSRARIRRAGRLMSLGSVLFLVIAVVTGVHPDAALATSGGSAVASISGGTIAVSHVRPTSVPGNYRMTPNGYFHPDCVHELGKDQMVVRDGSTDAIVTIPQQSEAGKQIATTARTGALPMPNSAGSKVGAADLLTAKQIAQAPHVSACTHPAYDFGGHPFVARSGSPATTTMPNINGWIEQASTQSAGAMSYLYAAWDVPPAPATWTPQTVYFFPGFEDLSNNPIILQPVLSWNQTDSGIAGWSAASWNCCSVGNQYHSPYIPVSGTTISGDISGNGCDISTGICSTWTIVTYDWGSQLSTTLNTTTGGRAMNWVFGGSLEAYNLSSCSQFPGNSVTFRHFYLVDVAGYIKNPYWSGGVYAGLSPSDCGFGVTAYSDNSVQLAY